MSKSERTADKWPRHRFKARCQRHAKVKRRPIHREKPAPEPRTNQRTTQSKEPQNV